MILGLLSRFTENGARVEGRLPRLVYVVLGIG